MYESPGRQPLAVPRDSSFAKIAEASGIQASYTFCTIEEFRVGMPAIIKRGGHRFVVAEIEPSERLPDRSPQYPVDMAYRFGRFIEESEGIRVFRDS
jgi:hypothetical protein